jgi:hypothetical protein
VDRAAAGARHGGLFGPEPNRKSHRDPDLVLTGLAAGDYLLAIGHSGLSQADALAGANSGGSSWEPDSFHNYQITFDASTDTLSAGLVPEPSSLILFVSGGLVVAWRVRRKT